MLENLLSWIWEVTQKLSASHKGLYSTGLDKDEVIPIPHLQVMKVCVSSMEIKFQLLSTLASCSSALIPAEITLDTSSVRHWLDSRANVDMMAKRKSALTKIQTLVTLSVTSKSELSCLSTLILGFRFSLPSPIISKWSLVQLGRHVWKFQSSVIMNI